MNPVSRYVSHLILCALAAVFSAVRAEFDFVVICCCFGIVFSVLMLLSIKDRKDGIHANLYNGKIVEEF